MIRLVEMEITKAFNKEGAAYTYRQEMINKCVNCYIYGSNVLLHLESGLVEIQCGRETPDDLH